MTRLPDGNGTTRGFNDTSSEAAGWIFDRTPTYSIVLAERDQRKWGDPGYFVWYSLNITNLQLSNDCIDITTQSEPGAWTIELYESDMVTPLVDKEPAAGCPTADGIPDTGPLAPNIAYGIWVKVYVPYPPGIGLENTTVYAQSSLDTLGRDGATLKTFINPYIDPDATIDPPAPTTIYEKSAGALGLTNETTLTLNASGRGFLQFTGQDVVFVLDSSGSMEWNDPDPDGACNPPLYDPFAMLYRPARVDATWNYVDNFTAGDRGGYVDFDTFATLRVPLALGTSADNYDYLKMDIPNGLWCSDQVGGTIISNAMGVANQELILNGNPNHVKVQILLTDAEQIDPLDDIQSRVQADFAAANNILIFTIGLNVTTIGPPGGIDLLSYIAATTGGQFFPAPDPSALSDIFSQILDMVRSIAGYNPTPGNPSLMIKFVLEQGIEHIDGTFKLVPGTIEIDPNPDSVTYNPTNITLEWEWTSDEIRVGEYWAVRFNISSTILGASVPVNIVPDSSITYLSPNGINLTNEFPLLTITVIPPGLQPIITSIVVEPGGLNITYNQVVGAEQYEIYGGTTQTSIDLAVGNELATIMAPQTWWLDTTNLGLYDEFYYVVRAVDTGTIPWTRSISSNTAGFYRVDYTSGTNALSLPLDPIGTLSMDTLMTDLGASSVSIQDVNDDWQTYTSSPPGNAQVGTGYVFEMPTSGSHVFTGEPASMVLFQDGFGFDDLTRDSLSASVDVSGDVTLSWAAIPNAQYYILWSNLRNGFHTGLYSLLNSGLPVAGTTYVDVGAAASAGQDYYIVIPYNGALNGSSSYSIGVWTAEYNGNEMFGLPLKPDWGVMSADWYVDQIDFCLGINFLENGIWKAHFKEFPEGVYDTMLEMGFGYQLSVYDTSIFSYVGW
jgi:hypothetical protein